MFWRDMTEHYRYARLALGEDGCSALQGRRGKPGSTAGINVHAAMAPVALETAYG